MKLLFWTFIAAVVLVSGWEIYLHYERQKEFAGMVYTRDGRPVEVPPPGTQPAESTPASNTLPPAQPAVTPTASTAAEPSRLAVPVRAAFTPTPPTGVGFVSIGNFEWYQQGDLTWRLDLHSGASCVAFATPQAWQKQAIYRHSCGRA